jgi:hypothetical protein
MKTKKITTILFLFILLGTFILAQNISNSTTGQQNGVVTNISNSTNNQYLENQSKFCTKDLRQCPDGNYVGRNPNNNCEFYPCNNQTNSSFQFKGDNGKNISIQARNEERKQIHAGNSSAETILNLTREQIQNTTKLRTNLSNGRNAEIKIMPDVASETALNRLRLKVCSEENNCTIELKEVGQREDKCLNLSEEECNSKSDCVKLYGPNPGCENLQEGMVCTQEMIFRSCTERDSDIKLAYELKTQRQAKILGIIKAQMRVQAQIDAENGEVIQIKKPWWAFLATEPEE